MNLTLAILSREAAGSLIRIAGGDAVMSVCVPAGPGVCVGWEIGFGLGVEPVVGGFGAVSTGVADDIALGMLFGPLVTLSPPTPIWQPVKASAVNTIIVGRTEII